MVAEEDEEGLRGDLGEPLLVAVGAAEGGDAGLEEVGGLEGPEGRVLEVDGAAGGHGAVAEEEVADAEERGEGLAPLPADLIVEGGMEGWVVRGVLAAT